MKLKAYHNDPAIKRKYMRRVTAYRKADLLTQGAAGKPCNGEKGCAVACTMDKYDHSAYEIEIGVPVELAHLEDAIFEGLNKDDAMQWPARFLKAIPVGADLSLVCAQFAIWNLTDEKFGANSLPYQPPEAINFCRRVAQLWQRVMDGESQAGLSDEFEKEEAGARAWAGAGAVVGAVAVAWAWAWVGAGAVEAGRGAVAVAWAWERAGYWRACADKLEALFKAAPVK